MANWASVRPCPAPPARRCRQSEWYGKLGVGTALPRPPRAHCLSENRSRRLSALRSAVKTDKNGAFRYSKKAAPFLSLASEARS